MTQAAEGHRYTAGLAGEIETRWQSVWAQRGVFTTPNPGDAGFDATRPKFYALDMFPYPSGAGLHVGHPEGYTATDIICRYKRMKGFNVLHPMGWDAFGLPAEQYAIQTGVHPAVTTRRAIDTFRRQLQRFGFSYDWSREFGTIDEGYYRWTQWIFLRLYHAWYDTEAGRARPISELIELFERGERAVKLNPAAAEYAGAGDVPGGTDAGSWATLDGEARRAIVDSYRLAYCAMQTVNWCPKLGTALANEEVIDGRSERGGYPVYRKPLRQWMLRITAYADRLLDDLELVDWPASTKTQQAEWIGRSEGAEIDFPLVNGAGEAVGPSVRVFTTRPDTIYGATYMVLAPEHPLVEMAIEEPAAGFDASGLRAYVERSRNLSDVERQESKEKTGEPTGLMARNPVSGALIPVWSADYVLMGYGTGAIMGVPAQDERDWAFAERHGLPIVRTVRPPEGWEASRPYTGDGPAMNSGFLDGLGVAEAKAAMIAHLERERLGQRRVNYRLRDWLFSRQRYWGEPFPIVYDGRGQHHGVMEGALPVRLPEIADYAPEESEEPRPLLAKAAGWVRTTAGEAGVEGLEPGATVTRETNTMPGWAGSCWYYLRYLDPKNGTEFVSREAERYWMGERGVDLYVGGAEHAVLHLLYARFWHKVLYDLGEVGTPEPFARLFHQGLILSSAFQREDGSLVAVDEVANRGSAEEPSYEEVATGRPVRQIVAKMSKSLRNVVNPDEVIAEYGADTFRLYEMYMGPLEAAKPWNTRDISGMHRFLQRLWRLCIDEGTGAARVAEPGAVDMGLERRLHRATERVGQDIERLAFNTAIAALIEMVNAATKAGEGRGAVFTADQLSRLMRLAAPFVPHLAEEVWARLGLFEREGPVSLGTWPTVDPAMLVDDEVEVPVQVNGKVRGRVIVAAGAGEAEMKSAALADSKIAEALEGRAVRKVVVVPGRLINIVAG